jgi:hypothetical protein
MARLIDREPEDQQEEYAALGEAEQVIEEAPRANP